MEIYKLDNDFEYKNKMINFYYCTNNFKQIVEQNGLKGLEFTKIGVAH